MRIRTVKPEFFTHDGLFDLEKKTKLPLRIAFIGVWCFCDREGRFKWKPRQMKPCILPHDTVDFEKVLDALRDDGFIVQYEHEGEDYGYVPSFHVHQFINNKEAKSTLPSPFDTLSRVKDATGTRLGNYQGERKGKEGKDEARVDDASQIPLEDWLNQLQEQEAYKFLNVKEQWSRMGTWCSVNRKQATRRRFVSWLNRCERPENGGLFNNSGYIPDNG